MSRRLRTARRPPSHVSTSWARRLTRFTSNFPRLLRTDYWKTSRARGLWSSLFAREKSARNPPHASSKALSGIVGSTAIANGALPYVNDNWNLVADTAVLVCWMPVTWSTTSMMPIAPLVVATIGTDAFGTVTTTSVMAGATGSHSGCCDH